MSIPQQARPIARQATTQPTTRKGILPSGQCGCANACIGVCVADNCYGVCV